MSIPHSHSRAICVLGMHRSGTSTISRAINLLGAYLGEEKDLYGPAPDNPEGYWERKEFVDFHDRLLGKLRRRWHTTVPLEDGWFLAPELQSDREELGQMIRNGFSEQTLWAWKDPRTCILIDLWKHLLNELQVTLSVVFVVRNPIDVARSLKTRDGFSLGKSFGIWFNYNISALQGSRDLRPIFISYDRFLENSEAELRRCAAALGLNFPKNEAVNETLRTFVRKDLRHSQSHECDLQVAPAPVQAAYGLLTQALNNPLAVGPQFVAEIEQLYAEFSAYSHFFRSDMDLLWEKIYR